MTWHAHLRNIQCLRCSVHHSMGMTKTTEDGWLGIVGGQQACKDIMAHAGLGDTITTDASLEMVL